MPPRRSIAERRIYRQTAWAQAQAQRAVRAAAEETRRAAETAANRARDQAQRQQVRQQAAYVRNRLRRVRHLVRLLSAPWGDGITQSYAALRRELDWHEARSAVLREVLNRLVITAALQGEDPMQLHTTNRQHVTSVSEAADRGGLIGALRQMIQNARDAIHAGASAEDLLAMLNAADADLSTIVAAAEASGPGTKPPHK